MLIRLAQIVVMMFVFACSAASPQDVMIRMPSGDETFLLVANSFASSEQPSVINPNVEVRVDPRVLRGDSSVYDVHDALLEDSMVVAERIHLLSEADIASTDVVAMRSCRFSGGLPPPPDTVDRPSEQPLREECTRFANIMGLAIATPRPLQADLERGAQIAVRVIAFTNSSHEVYDVILLPSRDTWYVRERKLLKFMAS